MTGFERGDLVEIIGERTMYDQPQTGRVLRMEGGLVHVHHDPLIGTMGDTISLHKPEKLKKLATLEMDE